MPVNIVGDDAVNVGSRGGAVGRAGTGRAKDHGGRVRKTNPVACGGGSVGGNAPGSVGPEHARKCCAGCSRRDRYKWPHGYVYVAHRCCLIRHTGSYVLKVRVARTLRGDIGAVHPRIARRRIRRIIIQGVEIERSRRNAAVYNSQKGAFALFAQAVYKTHATRPARDRKDCGIDGRQVIVLVARSSADHDKAIHLHAPRDVSAIAARHGGCGIIRETHADRPRSDLGGAATIPVAGLSDGRFGQVLEYRCGCVHVGRADIVAE